MIVLAHPSVEGMKDGRGYSGTVQWNNGFRSRSYFNWSPDNHAELKIRRLERAKANRTFSGEKIELIWEKGVLVQWARANQQARENAIDAVFFKLLSARSANNPVSPHKQAGNYAPRTFHQLEKRYSVDEFEESMARLEAATQIKREKYGNTRHGGTRLVVATCGGAPSTTG
jgi:RecA-family ATPase